MTAIQSILAATDFLQDAHDAVRRAALLATALGARLQLLHVMQTDALDELRARLRIATDVRQRLRDDAQRSLDELAEELGETVRSSQLAELFLGGTTRATVARAKCDVVVVVPKWEG